MTVDQIIALTASIGACLSAIAAFLAVKQNSKQREESYKPELALTLTVFSASKHPLFNGSFAEFWTSQDSRDEQGNDRGTLFFSIPLRNIGLGAAKEVTLDWSFSIDDLIATINKKAQRLLIPAYFEFESETLSLRSEQLKASISNWKSQKKYFIDYVLPAPADSTGALVRVPPLYIELVSALIFFSSKEEDGNRFSGIPSLNLNLEYFDIGGVKHKASFEIELHLEMILGSGEEFRGYMRSKKNS